MPKPPEVKFALLTQPTENKSFRAYLIDYDTICDLLAAVYPKTASQAYRRAILLEILEQNTSLGGGAEKEVEL